MRRPTPTPDASPTTALFVSGLLGLLVGLAVAPATGVACAVVVLLIAGSGPPRRAIPVPARARRSIGRRS